LSDTLQMTKNHLQLSPPDRQHLQQLIQQNNLRLKVYRRAQGLLALDQGHTLQQAAAVAGVNYNSVATWRDAYRNQGLSLLEDKPRSGRPIQIDGKQRAAITALACSTPPEGRARWSLRLLADKVVELGYLDSISHDSIHHILKKTNSSHISKRRGA
jgi:putative transposase